MTNTASMPEPTPDPRAAIMTALRQKYIKSPRYAQLCEEFGWLMERAALPDAAWKVGANRRLEGRALAVPGNSGAGKTTAVEYLLAFASLPAECQVVFLTAPSPCTLKTLGRALLRALGYPLEADRKEHEIWEMVHKHLKLRSVRLVWIDEMQNATSKDKTDEAMRVRIRNTFKSLLNAPEHPVCLILSGMPEIREFLEEDMQLLRRTRFVPFGSMSESDAAVAKATIKTYADMANLQVDYSGQLALRLIHAGADEFGTMVDILLDTIDHALKAGKTTLTREEFATAFARRSANAAPANPFVADNWRSINCKQALLSDPRQRDAQDAAKDAAKAAARRGRKR